MAHLTGSMMWVKWEIRKYKFFNIGSTLWTRSMDREMVNYFCITINWHISISFFERNTKWIIQTSNKIIVILLDESIDDNIYLILFTNNTLIRLSNRIYCIFNLKSYKTHICNSTSDIYKWGDFICKNERDKNMKSTTFAKLRHMFDNIFYSLFSKRNIWMIWTMWYSYTCIEESIIIIYFSNSSNCRSWIVRHCLLMNSNCWRKTTNFPHTCRFGYIRDNHTSISRKWFKISSLSLCIESIKSKWRFPRAWNSGYYHKFIFWKWNGNRFEIMRLCNEYIDSFWHNIYEWGMSIL